MKDKQRKVIKNKDGKPRKKRIPNTSDALVIRALHKAGGLQLEAARILNMDYCALSERINNSPLLLDERRKAKEAIIDEAEEVLRANIQKGKEASLIFFLKCQAKHRGYCEKDNSQALDLSKIRELKEFFDSI